MSSTHAQIISGAPDLSRSDRVLDRVLSRAVADGVVSLPAPAAEARAHVLTLSAEVDRVRAAGFDGRRTLAHKIATGAVKAFDKVGTFAEVAAYEVRLEVLRRATGIAASIYFAEVRDTYGEEILAEVGSRLVDPAVEILTRAASLTTESDTVESLIADGNVEAATALVEARKPATLAALRQADEIRKGIERLDDAPPLPWLIGSPLASLDVESILARLRRGETFLDFLDPVPFAEVGLVEDEDDDDETPRPIHPTSFYPAGPLAPRAVPVERD